MNQFGLDGVESLSVGLQHCSQLVVLDLCNNNITSDGIAAIVGVMERYRFLQQLDLSGNNIGVDGAAVLVGGWQHNSVLTLPLS